MRITNLILLLSILSTEFRIGIFRIQPHPSGGVVGAARSHNEERYSFSLTTFDPTGRLGQVDRAQQAASMGTPVIAITLPSSIGSDEDNNRRHGGFILLASPQHLPSIFMMDDGTPRFTQITNEIVISHSGLSADGRVLIAAAQRVAIEYDYTFDEEIPCSLFLQQLSLLMQEYTMKPGTRPFGACLIVAHVPAVPDSASQSPDLFRIDPSGNVERLFDDDHKFCTIIHGNHFFQKTKVLEKLELLVEELALKLNENLDTVDMDKIQNQVAELIREAFTNNREKDRVPFVDNENHGDISDEDVIAYQPTSTILTACLSSSQLSSNNKNNKNSFSRKRHYPKA